MFDRARRATQPPRDASGEPGRPTGAQSGAAANEEATLLRQIESALEMLVAGSLRRADDAADHGDYAEALAWLQTVDPMKLPPEYEVKRSAWLSATDARQADGTR